MKAGSLVFLLALILSACGGGSSLVGKWEGTDPDSGALLTVEYRSDGTVTFEVPDFMTLEGTYRLVDANTFEMTLGFTGETDSQTGLTDFTIVGDMLTMTSEGTTIELQRVP
ncbi:MAG: hypothetical protein WEC16_00325 [Anaerolineales bacterium]